ncbi:septum formation initiator family protein [Bacillus shivajii]|uniref:FtsB family cell division protein n=1 Tax=Bacillus shivajii TaxID=1983719 RepID=UPI001CFA3B34|nr:septum formation initiator family protein [Bacillus shivajii]UCZ53319.1 septum formation initiator family protein [Bacillus shivajii]
MREEQKQNIRKISSEYVDQQALLHEQKLRRRKGVIRRLTVFSFAMFIIAIFTGVTLYNQHVTLQEQKYEHQQLEKELMAMKQEEAALLEEIDLLHDPEYIAEIARRDFFLTKPGETLFQLPRSSSSD